jgi:hypothetical protein
MSLRSSTIYVEPKTVKRLLVLAKLYPERTSDVSGVSLREKTADERADALLNEVIKEKFPAVIELERLLAKTEKDFLAGVNKQTNNENTIINTNT